MTDAVGAGPRGKIEGHAFAYRARRLARQMGLWDTTKDVFRFLLDGHGLVITGACSNHECRHNTQNGTTNLGETCSTVYLLRFYDELIPQIGAALYGGLIERGIYSALFCVQSPNGRKIRY